MLFGKNKTFKARDPIHQLGAALALLFLGAAYLRLFFSHQVVTDESQYVGSAFLSALGGKPFYNEMFFQQTGSLIYEPLALAYHSLFGREGIFLFARHVYFLLAVGCAYGFFRWYRRSFDFLTACLVATLPLVGSAYSALPSVSYNTVGCLFFGLSLLFAVRGVKENRSDFSLISGVCSAVATFAYPTMGAAAVAQWVLIAAWRFKLRFVFLRHFLIASASGAVMLALLFTYLIFRFGWPALLSSYQFTTGFSALGSASAKLRYSADLVLGFAPPIWIFALLMVAWMILYRKWRISWYWLALVLGCIVIFKEPPERMPFTAPLLIVLCLSFLPVLFMRLYEDSKAAWTQSVIFFTGFIMVPIICWTSGITMYATSNVTIFMICAAMGLESRGRKLERLAGFFIPLFIAYQQFLSIEVALPATSSNFISRGPYAGVFVSPYEKDLLDRVQRDINLCESRGAKSALFYDEFAPGVLMTNMAPATRSIFMHGLDQSARVRQFYTDHYTNPDNRPDCVFRFLTMAWGDVTPRRFHPYPDVFWYYLPEQTREYEMLTEEKDYQVYLRKRPL